MAAVWITLTSQLRAEQPAQVRGLWVMPNEFRSGTEVLEKDDILEKQGKKFLDVYKRLNPTLDAKVLTGNQVTRKNVIREIRKQLEAFDGKLQPCMFILYYGGHGIRPSTRSRASTYLALQGAEISTSAGEKLRYDEMIQMDEIFSILSEFEHVYFQAYVDCCYAANMPAGNLSFTSGMLGNNGFAICSSSSDRQAIVNGEKSLTLGLIDVFESPTYGEIKSPTELFERVQNSKPAKSLGMCYLPWSSEGSLVQWPLPKLCYLVIDFGQVISRKSVAVTVSDASGNHLFTRVLSNGNQDTMPVLMRSIAVPRSNIKLQIRIGSNITLPSLPQQGYPLSLADSRSHHFTVPKSDLASGQISGLSSHFVTSAVDAILTQGAEFGMDRADEQNIVISALSTGGKVVSDDARLELPSWAKRFDGELYEADFRELIGDFTGKNKIPLDSAGYSRLVKLGNNGLNYSSPVAEALASHLMVNIESQVALKQGEKPEFAASWIKSGNLIKAFEQASAATASSKNEKSLDQLEEALHAAKEAENPLFNANDFGKASKAVNHARDAIEK